LRLVRDEAARHRFGAARLTTLADRARGLALRDARIWAAKDPVAEAYAALAGTHEAAGHFDSAAAVLGAGMTRTQAPGTTTLPFTRAIYLAHVDPLAAAKALREALAGAQIAGLRENGGGDRFPLVLQSAAVAG